MEKKVNPHHRHDFHLSIIVALIMDLHISHLISTESNDAFNRCG